MRGGKIGLTASLVALVALPSAVTTGRAQESVAARPVFLLAGNGETELDRPSPEGLPATSAPIEATDVAVAPDGSLLVSDFIDRVRRIALDGRVTNVAGRGPGHARPGDVPARRADIPNPSAVASLPDGGFLVAQTFAPKVLRVTPDGGIATVAGNGREGSRGDGGPATAARFVGAADVVTMPDGGFLIADDEANRIRRVTGSGLMTTVAGNGDADYKGDGGPARRAALNDPVGLAVRADGSVLIADGDNDRIRQVDAAGVISTIAGNGKEPDGGDGGPAIRAAVSHPTAVAPSPDGGFMVADDGGVRRVDANGTISTVVSSEAHDFAGRRLDPTGLAPLPDGGLAVISGERIWMIASAKPQRLAVALQDLSSSAGSVEATIATTGAGTAVLQVLRHGRVRAERSESVAVGGANLKLAGRFAAGRGAVRVTLTDAGGHVASDEVAVYLGSALRLRAAVSLIDATLGDSDEGGGQYVKRCHRFTARRIDCEVREEVFTLGQHARRVRDYCTSIRTVVLARSGIPSLGHYHCPRRGGRRGGRRFRRRP